MLNKGIAFTGCSHTWGSGLYFYTPFIDIKNAVANNTTDSHNITQAMYKFMSANRFSRLVADKLGTWEVNKIDNGGSDDGSITWLEYIIDLENETDTNALSKKHYKKFADQHYSADEIGYVILQLTDPFRNYQVYINDEKLELNVAGVRDRHNLNQNNINMFDGKIQSDTYEKLFKFYSDNFTSWEDMEKFFIKQNLKLIKELFIKYEAAGIKCRILTWQNEYVPFLIEDEFFKNIFIKMYNNGIEYNSLADLMKSDPQMMISTSDLRINGNKVPDDHASLECHKIIADSISDYILKEING
jgi:hypothetical protein